MKFIPLCLLFALFISACRDNDPPTGPKPPAGFYRTTVFIRPTPVDGIDSAHLRGDYIEVTLNENGSLTGVMRVSSEYNGSVTEVTQTFSGTYTATADSIFMDTQPSSEADMLGWKRTGDDLVAERRAIGSTYIYLKRQ